MQGVPRVGRPHHCRIVGMQVHAAAMQPMHVSWRRASPAGHLAHQASV